MRGTESNFGLFDEHDVIYDRIFDEDDNIIDTKLNETTYFIY